MMRQLRCVGGFHDGEMRKLDRFDVAVRIVRSAGPTAAGPRSADSDAAAIRVAIIASVYIVTCLPNGPEFLRFDHEEDGTELVPIPEVSAGKTSTFVFNHDRCDPSQWTPTDVMALYSFLQTGSMLDAGRLASIGVHLLASDHHVAAAGVEELGWASAKKCDDDEFFVTEELDDIVEDIDEVYPLTRIYRGPVQYAVKIAIGDGEGNFDGYEYEVKPTEAEAKEYLPEHVR